MTDMNEILKAQEYITSEILEYVTNDVVTKTILKKTSGTVSIMAFDQGQGLLEKSSPFDHFMQFIDGSAELVISGASILLQTGHSILVPAHAPFHIKPNGRFKIILTLIKSGYE